MTNLQIDKENRREKICKTRNKRGNIAPDPTVTKWILRKDLEQIYIYILENLKKMDEFLEWQKKLPKLIWETSVNLNISKISKDIAFRIKMSYIRYPIL